MASSSPDGEKAREEIDVGKGALIPGAVELDSVETRFFIK